MAAKEVEFRQGDFLFRWIGKNHMVIFPHPSLFTKSCIAMTGLPVKKVIHIPFFHRVNKLCLNHMDSSYNESTQPLTIDFEVGHGQSSISGKHAESLWSEGACMESKPKEEFGEGFEYEGREYTLSLTSVNGDLILPVLYIQKEGSV